MMALVPLLVDLLEVVEVVDLLGVMDSPQLSTHHSVMDSPQMSTQHYFAMVEHCH